MTACPERSGTGETRARNKKDRVSVTQGFARGQGTSFSSDSDIAHFANVPFRSTAPASGNRAPSPVEPALSDQSIDESLRDKKMGARAQQLTMAIHASWM